MKTADASRYNAGSFIEGLRARDNRIVTCIYSMYFSKIKNMVIYNSGLNEDAEDLFQDAMVIIINNVSSSAFKLTSSFGTYLFSICWHLWLQRLNKIKDDRKHRSVGVRDYEITEPPDNSFYHAELLRLVELHFEMLDKTSQQLLTLYMNGTPHKTSAEILGFHSTDYAKIRKFLSKEKLRALIEKDPQYKSLKSEMQEN